MEAKEKGNGFYAEEKYAEAIQCYSGAIEFCPDEDVANKSIFFSNRAACYVMQKNWSLAVKDCSESLKLNAGNLKTLNRRAKSFEELDKLYEALEDYKAILALEPNNVQVRKTCARLEPIVKARTEQQKEEVMGKLKELGNGLLGKFGLSLDNFKTQQDPNTGSYNISFSK